MGRVCRQVHEWIEETIERPLERLVEQWEERREERCGRRRTRIGRFFCRLVTRLVRIVMRVVVFVTVTVTKWIIRVVCEAVSAVLDVAAFVVNLVLSIPIIGGIIRTILNWVTEIIWRVIGLADFVLSLLGIRIRKRMYVGIIIPSQNGSPITTEAVMLPQILAAQTFFDTQGNINLVYTGACISRVDARGEALNVPCNASGFFSDWWLNGSYYEFLSSFCKFEDGWRRILGYGAEILVIAVNNVRPDTGARTTVGCSFGPTYNYVVVEPGSGPMVTAHEIGHACNLLHRGNPNNLMTGSAIPAAPTITNAQIALIRWSKHCVFF